MKAHEVFWNVGLVPTGTVVDPRGHVAHNYEVMAQDRRPPIDRLIGSELELRKDTETREK